MKKWAILILVGLGTIALGCGHSNLAEPTQTSTNGFWEAQLIGGLGDASELNFVTQFSVTNTNGGSPEPLSITSFGFINLGSCFVSQSENGSASLNTSTTNQVTGSMTYTIQSIVPPGNTLILTADNTVTGTATGSTDTTLNNGIAFGGWKLTTSNSSSDCQGSGSFVMCQGTATCTPP